MSNRFKEVVNKGKQSQPAHRDRIIGLQPFIWEMVGWASKKPCQAVAPGVASPALRIVPPGKISPSPWAKTWRKATISNQYCWWCRNPANQLRLVVYPCPIIYKVFIFQVVGNGIFSINSIVPYPFSCDRYADIPHRWINNGQIIIVWPKLASCSAAL